MSIKKYMHNILKKILKLGLARMVVAMEAHIGVRRGQGRGM
jgi:hypothetical protein